MNRSASPRSYRLAVIPSDPLSDYFDKGQDEQWMEDYYNPGQLFERVYVLSPLESEDRHYGRVSIIKTKDTELPGRLRAFDIDVVRAYGAFWPCDMACRFRADGIPVVVSVHDTNPELMHETIRYADAVLCVSQVVKDTVMPHLPSSLHDRVWILPNRVDRNVMRSYDEDATRDLAERYPFRYRILHVGRKSVEKNLDTVIKALKLLGPEYGLIAVGAGDEQACADLAEKEGVRQQCVFHAHIAHKELPRYYSLADAMCVPSRWEGFGMVFIEAMACGAVVVTSDIAPMNTYIRHEHNGHCGGHAVIRPCGD
jgi:glycosyltransferase involved in cell wall biosynthesis